jgi:hypothetical protein
MTKVSGLQARTEGIRKDVITMKRVIYCSSTNKWYMKYYTEATPEQICEETGCYIEDLVSAEELDGYDAKHVAWLIAKPEYQDVLDCYSTIELVEEGGEQFLGFVSGERLYDVDWEIKQWLRG